MEKAVLLVEDSFDDETIFRQIMLKSGWTTPLKVVRDGSEAIAYLKGEGEFADRDRHPLPEILFLDLKLPKVSGFDVLEWMRKQEHLKDILVVVLSHYGETAQIDRAYHMGAHSFLTKPVKQEDFVNLTTHFSSYW